MTWAAEDGGPQRRQTVGGGLHLRRDGGSLEVTTRIAPAATMVVGGGDEGLYLMRHTAGEGATATVERIDPATLDPLVTSRPLAGGPVWPGGAAVNRDGSLTVVFGNHAHRLDPDDLHVVAEQALPRHRPYNSFVGLPDGHLVTKDFGGALPGGAPSDGRPCELLVLDPVELSIVASLELGEPSIARLSADGDDIYVVGDSSLLRVRWDPARSALTLDTEFLARYRTMEGQTYGWDCVLAADAAWFLDNGAGSERFTGTLRGHGVSEAPLHLVRADLETGVVTMAEVCGQPGGLIANPPIVDESRGIVVGYDSGNGVIAGFDLATLDVVWRRDQNHASHLLLYADTGELVTGDSADVVILDIATGGEVARADTGLGMQSVLFPAPGRDRDFYVCAFPGVSRIAVR